MLSIHPAARTYLCTAFSGARSRHGRSADGFTGSTYVKGSAEDHRLGHIFLA